MVQQIDLSQAQYLDEVPEGADVGMACRTVGGEWFFIKSDVIKSKLSLLSDKIYGADSLKVYADVSTGLVKGIDRIKGNSTSRLPYLYKSGVKTANSQLSHYSNTSISVREAIFPVGGSGGNTGNNHQEIVGFTFFMIINIDKGKISDGNNYYCQAGCGGSSSSFHVTASSSFQGERLQAAYLGVSGTGVVGNYPENYDVFIPGINIISVSYNAISGTEVEVIIYLNGQVFSSDNITLSNARFSPSSIWGQSTNISADDGIGFNAYGCFNEIKSQRWIYENIYNPWRIANSLDSLEIV